MKAWIQVLSVFGLLAGLLATAVPVSADNYDYYFRTYAQTPYPRQYSDEVVWVVLSSDSGGRQPMAGVPVHTVWNYRTTTAYADWQTGGDGKAAMIRNISDATCGYTVRVDIYIFDDQEQVNSAFFTPCGDSRSSSAPSYSAPPPPAYNPPPPAPAPIYNPPPAPAPIYNPPPQQQSSGPVGGSGGVCPVGYPVKGNANSGIYHQPGQQYYSATNANNCYASGAAAERDGYRASKV